MATQKFNTSGTGWGGVVFREMVLIKAYVGMHVCNS